MKILLFVLTAVLAVSFVTGCQATPDEPVVIGKGDGWLEEKIAAQTQAALPSDLPESGTHVRQTILHEKLPIKIDIDAEVQLPETLSLPAVKVSPHRFTQQEADEMVDYLIGDAYFANYNAQEYGPRPVTGLLEEISAYEMAVLAYKAWLAAQPDREDGGMLSRMEHNLKNLRQEYLTAQEIEAFPEASRTLSQENVRFGGGITDGIYGYFEKDGYLCRLGVLNDKTGQQSCVEFTKLTPDMSFLYMYKDGIGETLVPQGQDIRGVGYSGALLLAEEAAAGIGAHDAGMRLAHVEGREYDDDENSHYLFTFTREVGGVLCHYDASYLSADTYNGPEENRPHDQLYIEPWNYEKLTVRVDKHGVTGITWTSPYELEETLAQSTAILPFEDVMDCFARMAFVKNSYVEQELSMSITEGDGPGAKVLSAVDHIDIRINRIVLTLMRVQSGRNYIMIPVWDFYGWKELLTADGGDLLEAAGIPEKTQAGRAWEQQVSFMTINAIDGSIIDRGLGY